MTPLTIQAAGRFVQSPTFTTLSILVGVIASLLLTALVIEQEILQGPYPASRVRLRPLSIGMGVTLLLCFSIIVVLRLADLAYRRPGTTPTNTDTRAVVAARPTAAPGTGGPLAPSNPEFSQFFITGGESGTGEHTYVNLVNPTTRVVSTQLTFFFGNGRSATKAPRIPPTTEQEVPVSSLEPFTGPFDLRVEANQQIAVELRRGGTGQPYDLPMGTTRLATTWCRAQGYAYLTLSESAAILNPDGRLSARVTVHLQPRSKTPASDAVETIPPHSQLMVDLRGLALTEAAGLVVTADRPVCIARAPAFDKSSYTSTASGPRNGGVATSGITSQPMETYLLAPNPAARDVATTKAPNGPPAARYVVERVS